MRLKTRLEEEAFQKALQQLCTDEIALLDNSKAKDTVWGHLCILMSKADNDENRRACYDAWKKNRFNAHDIVNEMLQVCACLIV